MTNSKLIHTSRRPPPVSPRPPSGSFHTPQTGAPVSARARRLYSCTSVCVCSARRGCHPCDAISLSCNRHLEATHTTNRHTRRQNTHTHSHTLDLYKETGHTHTRQKNKVTDIDRQTTKTKTPTGLTRGPKEDETVFRAEFVF